MTTRLLMPLAFCALLTATSCTESDVMVRDRAANCGNGSIEVGEACDDGNSVNTDDCTNSCDTAFCGDGITRADLQADDVDFEACDDGNDNEQDGCLNTCILARCGTASFAMT